MRFFADAQNDNSILCLRNGLRINTMGQCHPEPKARGLDVSLRSTGHYGVLDRTHLLNIKRHPFQGAFFTHMVKTHETIKAKLNIKQGVYNSYEHIFLGKIPKKGYKLLCLGPSNFSLEKF